LVAYHFRTRENDTNIVWALGSHAGSNGDASNASHAAGGPVGMGIREDETPALRSGRTQAIAGAGVRRLTPVECERLQGFPDDWTAYGPDSRRYAALGDAVTVNVAEWIGRRLLETE
jgi:DNA (cytosine-5)-methyltransferase 1